MYITDPEKSAHIRLHSCVYSVRPLFGAHSKIGAATLGGCSVQSRLYLVRSRSQPANARL